jgi:hypothetical protein
MASHNIDITVDNNQIGTPASSDGVMMIFVCGLPIGNILKVDTAYLLSSLADGEALGLSAQFDAANNVYMWGHVNEFYDGGLNDGALLWFVVPGVTNNYTDYVTSSTFTSLVQYTAQSNPANRAKMIGFCYTVPQALQSSTAFLPDVLTALASIQAAELSMFRNYYQWSAILDGCNMSTTLTPAQLPTMTNKNAQSVSLCITGTQPNGVSGVGLALGRFARISVGHGFGAVADGPVSTPTAYLTNGIIIGDEIISGTGGVLQVGTEYIVLNAPIIYNGVTYKIGDEFTAVSGHTSFTTSNDGFVTNSSVTPVGKLTQGPDGDITKLGNSQYMFLCTQFGESGFFWNDAATCTSTTDAESQQEYNRVANSLSASALSFFTQFKGQALPSLPSTGALAPTWVATQQAAFNQDYIQPLVNNGDIVGATIAISGPTYNATGQVFFTLTIERSTILGNVTGTVTFSTTL